MPKPALPSGITATNLAGKANDPRYRMSRRTYILHSAAPKRTLLDHRILISVPEGNITALSKALQDFYTFRAPDSRHLCNKPSRVTGITSVLNSADFGSHLCPGLGFKLVITFIALVRGGVKQNERELFCGAEAVNQSLNSNRSQSFDQLFAFNRHRPQC